MTQLNTLIPLLIEIVTPTHIGDRVGYDFFSYVIKEDRLYYIDEQKFMQLLEKKGKMKEFLTKIEIVSEDELFRVKQFIKQHFIPEVASYSIPIDNDCEINDMAFRRPIERLVRNGLYRDIYIPGSTVKGALRTAYLNFVAKGKGKGYRVARELEYELMDMQDTKKYTDDPLRVLKFSDFSLYGGVPKIGYSGYRHDFEKEHANGIDKTVVEYMPKGMCFIGSLSISTNNNTEQNSYKNISFADVFQILGNCFVNSTLKKEIKFMNISKEYLMSLFQLNKEKKEVPIKLGKHSGSFAHVIDGAQRINIRNADNNAENQTTVWMINKMPMGWSKIRPIAESVYTKALEVIEEKRDSELAGDN